MKALYPMVTILLEQKDTKQNQKRVETQGQGLGEVHVSCFWASSPHGVMYGVSSFHSWCGSWQYCQLGSSPKPLLSRDFIWAQSHTACMTDRKSPALLKIWSNICSLHFLPGSELRHGFPKLLIINYWPVSKDPRQISLLPKSCASSALRK